MPSFVLPRAALIETLPQFSPHTEPSRPLPYNAETLWSYFDLGSIDDVEPRYPVTLDEARLLRRAVAALDHDRCQPIRRSRRWRGTV
ncbi:hypothetical protein K6V71_22560 [Cupriavidus gilardii]|uniref:hypothetical protein n=1 Tax=Cupriavidus gilardii TaxID=82541 RepID=UPI0021DACDF3